MNLTRTIESAELQFKQILEEFFLDVYNEKFLDSHGIGHHRRVWSYSKELLSLLAGQQHYTIQHLPSKLIIASYLHDIGMSVETLQSFIQPTSNSGSHCFVNIFIITVIRITLKVK